MGRTLFFGKLLLRTATANSPSFHHRYLKFYHTSSAAMESSLKFCIVVGLGRNGIGDHLVKKFSSEGYKVAMIARSNLEHLEKEIPNTKSYQCDAGNEEEVAKTMTSIQHDFILGDDDDTSTRIDALMYNVGSGVFKTFENTTYQEFDQSYRVGPAGAFLWVKACLPFMGSGCSIGLTGATGSWRGMPFTPAFAPSKMALRGLAQALARDLGPNKGIHVFHVIVDGMVTTSVSGKYAANKPENEMLNPAEIANVYWQLSQQPPSCWTQETHIAAQGAFGTIASI